MTETSPQGPQYREPGVKYRRVRKTRLVTTVIDGVDSQHEEEYWVDEPVPPRDWETVVERGLFVWAGALVVAAFLGTSASVGGLLDELLPSGVAYVLGLVFTGSWLGLLGLEWLDGRIDPDRATPARVAGWIALLIGMGAVFVYGYSHDLPWVGAAGASIDLAAKGFCTLLLRRYQVKLPKGVSTWVRRQEQAEAGRAVLADRIRRFDRRAAYRRAVGGREHQAAQAILTAAATPPRELPDTSGQPSGPVPGPTVAKVPEPAPPAPPTQPAPPVPPADPAGGAASHAAPEGDSGETAETPGEGSAPDLRPVGPVSIAAAVRQVRGEAPGLADAEFVQRVKELRGGDDGGDPVKFADTVLRTRRRQENPKKKRSA